VRGGSQTVWHVPFLVPARVFFDHRLDRFTGLPSFFRALVYFSAFFCVRVSFSGNTLLFGFPWADPFCNPTLFAVEPSPHSGSRFPSAAVLPFRRGLLVDCLFAPHPLPVGQNTAVVLPPSCPVSLFFAARPLVSNLLKIFF